MMRFVSSIDFTLLSAQHRRLHRRLRLTLLPRPARVARKEKLDDEKREDERIARKRKELLEDEAREDERERKKSRYYQY